MAQWATLGPNGRRTRLCGRVHILEGSLEGNSGKRIRAAAYFAFGDRRQVTDQISVRTAIPVGTSCAINNSTENEEAGWSFIFHE